MPEVIVMQCGADSLAGDEIGDFNLTSNGHGTCIKKVLGYNIPVVLLGGGGYNVVNVAKVPDKSYSISVESRYRLEYSIQRRLFSHYGTFTQLNVPSIREMANKNKMSILYNHISIIFQNLKDIEPVPSVQMMHPPYSYQTNVEYEEETNEDEVNRDHDDANMVNSFSNMSFQEQQDEITNIEEPAVTSKSSKIAKKERELHECSICELRMFDFLGNF